eukprot:4193001-Amphidinium_carterae.1
MGSLDPCLRPWQKNAPHDRTTAAAHRKFCSQFCLPCSTLNDFQYHVPRLCHCQDMCHLSRCQSFYRNMRYQISCSPNKLHRDRFLKLNFYRFLQTRFKMDGVASTSRVCVWGWIKTTWNKKTA